MDDSKLITSEIPPPSPANEKLFEHKRQLFPDGELNGGIAEISKQTQDDLRESGMKSQTDKTPTDLRKSQKRQDLSSPSRSSKRLAGGEPEIASSSVLNERSLWAAGRRSSGIKIGTSPGFSPKASATTTEPSEIEPTKEDPKHETLQVPEPPNQVENDTLATPEENVVEKQPDENNRSQELQLCNDFGDYWFHPFDDPLSFQGGLKKVDLSYNQTLRPPQPDPPIIFPKEFVPPAESFMEKTPLNQPTSSLFSDLGNLWSDFASQSSTDAGKTNSPSKFIP